jgi:hypothetical protein
MMATIAAVAMAEQELQDNVIELAHLLGWRVAHFRPAMTKDGWRTAVSADGKGFPDLVLVRDRVVFAELKSAKGVLTDEQADWVGALVGAKAECHLWKPVDWTDGTIERVLRGACRG